MTTPSTKKTYTIYFEVNKNNINLINQKTVNRKNFTGYDLGDSSFPSNTSKGCPSINSCYPNGTEPTYPIKGKYTGSPESSSYEFSQSSGSLSFSDFPMPFGSFNRGWSDFTGQDMVSYSCPSCNGKDTMTFSYGYQFNNSQSNAVNFQK